MLSWPYGSSYTMRGGWALENSPACSLLLPGRVLHLQHFVACVTADERLVFEGVHGLRGLDFPEQRRL